MLTNTSARKTVQSDERLLDIVEQLQQRNGARVTELANELELSKSTVHAHLATLNKRGYVVKAGDEYRLGMLFLNLGATARNRIPFFETIRPRIERLADQTNERAQFVVEEHGLGYVIFRSYGEYAVRVEPQVGEPAPLHTNASGKAILSALPEERVRDIIEYWGLERHTAQTITDEDALLAELEEIRERGYATNRGESRNGFFAVGAPIMVDGGVLGSITVSGPKSRMEERLDDEVLDRLLGIINEIELNISV